MNKYKYFSGQWLAIAFWFLSLCFAHASVAQSLAEKLPRAEHDGHVLTITTSQLQVVVSVPSTETFNVVYEQAGVKQLPGLALNDKQPLKPTVFAESNSHWVLSSGKASIKIDKNALKAGFYFQDELKVEEEIGLFVHQTIRGFRFQLSDDEKLYGGGQRVLGMNRRGHRMPLYNRAHYGYTTESNQMYYGLPAVLSSRHYAILFDNTANGYVDIGHTQSDILQFEADGGRTSYAVVLGENQRSLVSNIVKATGLQPLPPRWGLGNFASRFGYRSQTQVEDVVALYQQHNIPLDAIVLDLFWFGPDVKGHMGNLTWDRNAFPDPVAMISRLKDAGVNTVLITEPFILSTSSQYRSALDHDALAKNLAGEPRMFDFYFGHTGLVDVFSDRGRQWFWQYYQTLMEQGVTGWWGDLGEPEVHPADTIHNWDGMTATGAEVHNAYGHQWAKMVYENTLLSVPDKRPFLLMRAGFLGSQRYGMLPWTGDVSRSWGGLKPQVELALQMGVFGLAYTHSDLGGFAGGEVFDPELYLRWLNFGVFSPVFRPHAQEDIAPEPVYHDENVIRMAREMINLRYKMLPYNYSLAYENSLNGLPLMRPVSFIDGNESWFDNSESYLWGDAFLVTPVTEPNVTVKPVKLPPGKWYDFYNGGAVSGSQTVSVTVDINTIPVFVKAGAIVPMSLSAGSTKSYDDSQLAIHFWPDVGSTNSYILYEDAGDGPDVLSTNAYAKTNISAKYGRRRLDLEIETQGQFQGQSNSKQLAIAIHGVQKIGEAVEINGDKIAVEPNVGSVYWSDSKQTLHVNIEHSLHAPSTYSITW